MCPGTFFIANLPPIIAAARIGSVGVKQAAIASDEIKDNEGKSAHINHV